MIKIIFSSLITKSNKNFLIKLIQMINYFINSQFGQIKYFQYTEIKIRISDKFAFSFSEQSFSYY